MNIRVPILEHDLRSHGFVSSGPPISVLPSLTWHSDDIWITILAPIFLRGRLSTLANPHSRWPSRTSIQSALNGVVDYPPSSIWDVGRFQLFVGLR